MIDVFYIGQSCTMPFYTAKIRNNAGPQSLSDVSTLLFTMVRISTASIIVSATASVLETSAIDDNVGRVRYMWSVADTAVTGDFAAAFVFTTAAGVFSLPRGEMAKVVVENTFVTG